MQDFVYNPYRFYLRLNRVPLEIRELARAVYYETTIALMSEEPWPGEPKDMAQLLGVDEGRLYEAFEVLVDYGVCFFRDEDWQYLVDRVFNEEEDIPYSEMDDPWGEL